MAVEVGGREYIAPGGLTTSLTTAALLTLCSTPRPRCSSTRFFVHRRLDKRGLLWESGPRSSVRAAQPMAHAVARARARTALGLLCVLCVSRLCVRGYTPWVRPFVVDRRVQGGATMVVPKPVPPKEAQGQGGKRGPGRRQQGQGIGKLSAGGTLATRQHHPRRKAYERKGEVISVSMRSGVLGLSRVMCWVSRMLESDALSHRHVHLIITRACVSASV